MALMSWIVPRTLDACVHVTSLVRSESSGFRDSGVSLGFEVVRSSASPVHHLMARFERAAMETQGAMLASWSNLERMSSSPGWNFRAMDKLRKSWVVEGPITTSESWALM